MPRHLPSLAMTGLLAGFSLTAVAHADLVVLDSIAHGTLYESTGSQSANGLGAHLFAGNNGQDLSRRGLLRFDVASLGSDVVVHGATLRLHVSQANPQDVEVSMHRLITDWGVGSTDAPGGEGGGGPATPGSATWTHAFWDDTPWTNAGGDFADPATATSLVGGTGWYEWSGAGLVTDIQAMLDGDAPDFGWILLGDESGPSTAKRFDSRLAELGFRPELVVEFSVVPAPPAIAMLAFARNGRRRRRDR